MNILITGATGLIGRELGMTLASRGHRLFVITRNKSQTLRHLPFPSHVIEADIMREPIRDERLRHIEAVVHLAGESLTSKRWTTEQKKVIYDSRVKGTQNLLISLQEKAKLKVFVSSSAIGFYGDRGSMVLNESISRGRGFISDLCVDWEHPVKLAERKGLFPNCRFLIFRTGLVFSPRGGFLQRLTEPFRLGAGFSIGDGRQWMSWIDLQDLINLYRYGLEENELSGVCNAVTPEPLTMNDFAKRFAGFFHRKVRLRLPKIFFDILLGEMGQLLLNSQRVIPQVLAKSSFHFQFPTLEDSFAHIFSLKQKGVSHYLCEQFFPLNTEQMQKVLEEMGSKDIQIQSRLLKELMVFSKYFHELLPMSGGTFYQENFQYALRGPQLMRLFAEYFIRKELNQKFRQRRELLSQLQVEASFSKAISTS